MIKRPAQIDTPMGAGAELLRIFFPRFNTWLMRQHFLSDEESQASTGAISGDEIERKERDARARIDCDLPGFGADKRSAPDSRALTPGTLATMQPGAVRR